MAAAASSTVTVVLDTTWRLRSRMRTACSVWSSVRVTRLAFASAAQKFSRLVVVSEKTYGFVKEGSSPQLDDAPKKTSWRSHAPQCGHAIPQLLFTRS